jgi:hypothetical protein
MSRLVALLLLLGLLFVPGPAAAEEIAWAPEVPKGMDAGIVCMAEATFAGNSYRYTNYVAADADEPPDRERRWQISYCERIAREDVVRLFLVRWGQEIDPASVRITWEPYSP